jgi:hypothetical protein
MGLGIAIVLPFGLVFFASGLFINALQVRVTSMYTEAQDGRGLVRGQHLLSLPNSLHEAWSVKVDKGHSSTSGIETTRW